MRYKVIVNPIAGRGFGARATPTIQHLLSGHGLDYDLASTTYAGEAIELARQAVIDGYEAVVAAGGDGTYQEVINGMIAAYNGKMPAEKVVGTLGVLPVGSGSDLSYSVGIPSDLEGACARLAQAETRVIDLGQVTVYEGEGRPPTCRYFDNTVGIGFDGIVTLECKKFKYLRGMALYLPVVLKTVFVSLRPPRAVIEYEEAPTQAPTPALPRLKPRGRGQDIPSVGRPSSVDMTGGPPFRWREGGAMRRLEKTVLMAAICNGPREGGGFYLAPEAQNDDGLLDLLLADNLPRLQILGLIPHFMKGTHVDKPSVTMLRSRRIVITSPDNLIAHADGEMLCTEGHRIECEIAAQRVRVIG